MLSPILVPLDGSQFAELALPLAARLARAHGATLHLVTAADGAQGAAHPRRASALDYLQRVAERVRGEGGGEVTTALASEGGSAAEAIAREAERAAARLVVLTTHGHGGFSRLWLGSTTTALLGVSRVPLLVVRMAEDAPTPEPADPRHLLVAVEESAASAAALEAALLLAAPFGSRCTLLQVVRTADSLLPYDQTFWTAAEEAAVAAQRAEAEHRMMAAVERLRSRGVAAEGIVVLAPDPARVILQTAAEQGSDLVALGAVAARLPGRLGVGGVTDKVLRAATLPVLVVRAPEAG